MPRVTVLMPVFNGMPYLPEAVESILDQTLCDLEILILDDGSTDQTQNYLATLGDPRIKIQRRPHRGLGASLNVGLQLCKTEFIARMDADDVSMCDRLETQLDYLIHHQDVGAVGTQVAYFTRTDGRRGFSPPLYLEHDEIYAALLRLQHTLCHPTLLFRTAILKEIGGYQVDGIGEDWDIFLRLGEAARLANLDKVLYMYRLHAGSVTWTNLSKCHRHYAYASHSARRRADGAPEISFSEFERLYNARPLWKRLRDAMDNFAFIQYRRAIINLLEGAKIKGWLRLAWAGLCSPSRSVGRLKRELKKRITSADDSRVRRR